MRPDMPRSLSLIACLALALALGGCDSLRRQMGLNKNAPDEFAVVSKAPLVLPPDFRLRPPRPGAPRPQEESPSETARSTLLDGAGGTAGSDATPGGTAPASDGAVSVGESALLQAAGTSKANPNIREIVNRETSILVQKDRAFVDRLIFWQPEQAPGQVVDAQEEAERLRENAAAGLPPTEGETAVIERRRRGLLEGIF